MIIQIILNIIISAFIFLLIANSFAISYYVTKFFNISHAIIITFGGYFCYLLLKQLSISIWAAIPISVLLSSLLGTFFYLSVYKILIKRKTTNLLLLIASIGIYIVYQNLISLFWGDDTKPLRVNEVKAGVEIFGAYITKIQIITICVSLILFILCLFFLKFHKIGRNIRAVATNPNLSQIMGINTNKTILWSFAIGSALAAAAGILVAFDTGLSPTMGFNLLLYGVVAMIIGGVGSNWGLIGGAFLLSILQHLTAHLLDSKWMNAMTFILLIIFLIWKPLGFSGKRLKKIEL